MTIRYSGTQAEKYEQALNDAKDWLGTKVPLIVAFMNHEVRGTKNAYRAGMMACGMAGVQGLPARALVRSILRGETR